jgi:hypothetical protein
MSFQLFLLLPKVCRIAEKEKYDRVSVTITITMKLQEK